ncbi:MAG: LacI family DNA-binding transcriptional regulator [Nibricoccus sp.]
MNTERRVTLAEVAAKAGVHVTTVSLAIRNSSRLPDCTRLRLQSLAKEMGYTPDPLLKALVAYRGNVMKRRHRVTLAYVTNWKTCWGWKKVTAHPQFFAGAEAAARDLGYDLEHFWMREPGLTQERIGQILYSRGIKGLIIASHGREMGDALKLDWDKYAAIKIDYFPHQPALHNVTNNQCDIARLAVKKVREAGYQRVGFVMHRGWDHAVDRMWTAGFLCEQQTLPARSHIPTHLFPSLHPVELWLNEEKAAVVADVEPFARWYEKYKPEVIISKGSFVLPVLEKLGLRVPRDVAFVDLFLEDFSGKQAGVRQNHEAVGALAVELLTTQLQHNKFGVPEIPTTTFVEGTWFDGASCPSKLGVRKQAACAANAVSEDVQELAMVDA